MTRRDVRDLIVGFLLAAAVVLAFAVAARAATADPMPPNPDAHGPLWPARVDGVLLLPAVMCHGTRSGRTVCSNPGPTGIRHRIPPR